MLLIFVVHSFPYQLDNFTLEFASCTDCLSENDPYSGYLRYLKEDLVVQSTPYLISAGNKKIIILLALYLISSQRDWNIFM